MVANQANADGRSANLIVPGRDARFERLNHWLDVASQVPGFVGFAIGHSIWEAMVCGWAPSGRSDDAATDARDRISERYLGFGCRWQR